MLPPHVQHHVCPKGSGDLYFVTYSPDLTDRLSTILFDEILPVFNFRILRPLFAVLQGSVAPEVQGRVFTLFGSLVTVTSPIGLAIAGPVTDLVGIQFWYITAGVLCAGMGAWAFFVPAIAALEENKVGESLAGEVVPAQSAQA